MPFPLGRPFTLEPVVAQQSIQKVVGILRPVGRLGTDRNRGLVVIPVVPEVAFQSEILLEVVSEGGAEARRHIWKLHAGWSVVVAERGRNSAARVQPLIAGEDFVLRGFDVLRQSDGRQQNHS